MSAPYSRHRPCRLSQVPRWDLETEVLIVGFGAAGASAAIEAAGAGAQVCLLEAASGHGGTSALSGGEIYLGGNGGTPIQREAGFSDDTEDLYQYLLLAGGSDADAAKCRLYADNSLKHFEWLQAQGVVYKNSFIATRIIEPFTDDCLIWSGSEEAWPFIDKARPCPRGHTPQWMGLGGGKYLMDRLAERVQASGVDVQYDCRVQALIADDDNRVLGVVARRNNEDRFIRARKGVVLCAGGFIMNKAMLQQHAPKLLRANTPIGTVDDGSGIQLGQSVGGNAIHMNEGFVTIPWYPPQDLIKGIIINERGQRLINEDCYHGRVSQAILQDEGTRFFLLADSSFFAEPEWGPFAKIGIAAAGESWEEVERELELPQGALQTTVQVYNQHAARGEDPLFHKQARWLTPLVKPPFVALDLRIDHCIYSSFTLGGLHTRPTGEVLDAAGEAIPGLYAAGRTTSGLPRVGAGYSSGLSLADATFFGRQAGLRVAKA
ncbi:Succinate dehydrogenase/fumarate reductase, flavoprotein subunit [Solimonas aquatica]|uniref:Succinate dehydrogenase/fumarate reductase, flavoprotein subunit n=1 Tax=Solimonas aquatica TaxID=489703 RepID=A0A1H9KVV3_9GAMM|nr:FAD-dependent oxidoreductase [Solimonas aquatica]SER02997.1 Succinate dehydrogenase/fumarate reductase, flavoprotein subunit [Solimonas aquatica]